MTDCHGGVGPLGYGDEEHRSVDNVSSLSYLCILSHQW